MPTIYKTLFLMLLCFNLSAQSSFRDKIYNFKDSIILNPYYSIEQALSVSGYNKESVIIDQEEIGAQHLFDTRIKCIGNSFTYNAIKYISSKSKNTNVILINEAHNKPNHRLLLNQLIIELAPNYQFYLPESFIDYDCQISQGMPKVCPKYTFTNEPNFAKCLRSALTLGYKILPYENYNDSCFTFFESDSLIKIVYRCNDVHDTFRLLLKKFNLDQYAQREIIQAINIKRIINKFQNKKFIIHCGYAHVSRKEFNMAFYLKMLDIHFISIDQTYFNESIFPIKYLNEYQDHIDLNYPYLLLNRKDSTLSQFTKSPPILADIYVFHPPTKYLNNRPVWLKYNKSIIPCQIHQLFQDNNSVKNLYLIYIAKEFNALGYNSIPYDIIEQNKSSTKIMGYFEKHILYYIFRRSLDNKINKIEFKVDF